MNGSRIEMFNHGSGGEEKGLEKGMLTENIRKQLHVTFITLLFMGC